MVAGGAWSRIARVLERIFGAPVLRAAQLTPREYAVLRGAIGYVGSRLAQEQLYRTEEEHELSDAMVLLTILARFQTEVDPTAPRVRFLNEHELHSVCTALIWAATDLEKYGQHLRSWQGWSVEDQGVRDWLVGNFPDARDNAPGAEMTALILRTVWLTLREQHRTWTQGV
jgi:hypothetical protein